MICQEKHESHADGALATEVSQIAELPCLSAQPAIC